MPVLYARDLAHIVWAYEAVILGEYLSIGADTQVRRYGWKSSVNTF